VYANVETHWWDGSQVYGTTPERAAAVRDPSAGGGRLRLVDGGLPMDPEHDVELAGVNGNWWVGLSLVHTLFAREHNAICAMLADRHHDWDDERLFAVARRINAAVMAKIHTVEWTLAILPHPTVQAALRANWYGLFGPRGSRLFRRLIHADWLIGIPGSRRDDHGVPYSLTEEFVGVYRMHPLIPDDFRIVDHRDGAERPEREPMLALTGTATRDAVARIGRETLLASFGVGRAGALALRNYPDTLRDLPRGPVDVAAGDERRIDLATIDIARDRERGLPRYNDFRRMLRLPPLGFAAMSGADAEIEDELRKLYGDPDRVDLMVGLYGETPPPKFGFSETAFRIFVLMASRRLKADPLFTDDWGPELYTREGLRWIEEATMTSVIARNMPELAPLMADVKNAFAPWDDPENRRSGLARPFAPNEASA
jgi:hypothetical protein